MLLEEDILSVRTAVPRIRVQGYKERESWVALQRVVVGSFARSLVDRFPGVAKVRANAAFSLFLSHTQSLYTEVYISIYICLLHRREIHSREQRDDRLLSARLQNYRVAQRSTFKFSRARVCEQSEYIIRERQ